jgi:dephospho-CoA kinase
MLALDGAVVVDADAISRDATAAGGKAIAAIVQSFGPRSVGADGSLDRAWMREFVFRETGARARLENILHPLVAAEVQNQVNLATRNDVACVVLDIPLLVESKRWRPIVDRVLVVDCAESTQISRVVARSNLEPAQIRQIMDSQSTRAQRLRAADLVIFNDGIALSELACQVGKI